MGALNIRMSFLSCHPKKNKQLLSAYFTNFKTLYNIISKAQVATWIFEAQYWFQNVKNHDGHFTHLLPTTQSK